MPVPHRAVVAIAAAILLALVVFAFLAPDALAGSVTHPPGGLVLEHLSSPEQLSGAFDSRLFLIRTETTRVLS